LIGIVWHVRYRPRGGTPTLPFRLPTSEEKVRHDKGLHGSGRARGSRAQQSWGLRGNIGRTPACPRFEDRKLTSLALLDHLRPKSPPTTPPISPPGPLRRW
jgi:hypothetical protein